MPNIIDQANVREVEFLPPSEQEKAPFALHQVFNEDTLNELPKDVVSPSLESEPLTPSLWSKIISWWKEPEKAPIASSLESAESLRTMKSEPIPPIPVLEAPDNIPADLEAAKLAFIPKKTSAKKTLMPSEMTEVLAMMSEHTMDSIMFIIFKAQIELEKENANIAEGTFSKYADFQKLQEKVLEEIKDALVKDQNIAQHFKTALNLTLMAGFIVGLAACGLLSPLGGIVGAMLGPNAGRFFMHVVSSIGSAGPIVTGGLTGLTSAAKAYFQRLLNENKAKREEYSHQDEYYNDRVQDSRQRLLRTAEADSVFKEYWIRFLKRSDRMRKIVLKK